jgi:hypothetical protein
MNLQRALKCLLGQIGEDIPDSEFRVICNLNAVKHNFPVFDILAEKNGEYYVFSVKARKKYGMNGRINQCYNILAGSKTMSRKFGKALGYLREMGYDTNKIHYCFLVAPLEEGMLSTWYWGEFTEINAACTSENILADKINYFGVPMGESHLKTYKVFGSKRWEEIEQALIVKGFE